MHDPEKSDSGIVVMKPMNKAGRPAAELAEPRPGTKGNADQQSTHRTQSRARVIQALDRVRKAARQSKKEQFTSLVHHIERAVPLAFPPSAQLRLSDNDFSGSPQPTPTSSQRNTSGRAGWKRLGPVVTMRSPSRSGGGFRMLVMSRIRHAAIIP